MSNPTDKILVDEIANISVGLNGRHSRTVKGLWAVVACSDIGIGSYALMDGSQHIRDEMHEGGFTVEDWFWKEALPDSGTWRWEGSCTYYDDGDTVLRGKWSRDQDNSRQYNLLQNDYLNAQNTIERMKDRILSLGGTYDDIISSRSASGMEMKDG